MNGNVPGGNWSGRFPAIMVAVVLLLSQWIFAQTKVACIGNSITQNGDPGYVQVLSNKLGSGFDVRNYGISGRTMLKNGDYPYWNEPQWQDVRSWNPDVVTIMLGTNDSKPWNWDTYKGEFLADYREMVETLAALPSNPQILLALPPHAGEETYSIRGSVIKEEQIPMILQLAGEKDLPVIDLNTPTRDKLHLFPDEVHPGPEGHALLADVFYEGISNALGLAELPRRLLWYGDAPFATGDAETDKPWMDILLPPDSVENPGAVIVCPGGGYEYLAGDYEGRDVAEWFNNRGFAAFVLHYRYSPYRHPTPLTDLKRAMRIVRYYAGDFGLDSTRIGVLGFSAGGHLASTLGTHFDPGRPDSSDYIERKKSRPDFMVLIYPVITLEGQYAHEGSRNNLLGSNPDPQLVSYLSSQKQVTPETPHTFLAHGSGDGLVPIQNSEMMVGALNENSVENQLFVDPGKGHGFGMDGQWPPALEAWLNERELIPVSVSPNPGSLNQRFKSPFRHRLQIYYGHYNAAGQLRLSE